MTTTKKVEQDYYEPCYCPFCKKMVINPEQFDDEEAWLDVCEHTLFVAHDHGFSYRSEKFDTTLHVTGLADEEFDLPGKTWTETVDFFNIEGTVLVEAYQPAPCFEGSYIAFTPENTG